MNLTDNLKLPFPGEDDTGATALYLETLARAVDAKLTAYRDAWDGYNKPPCIITQTTVSDQAYTSYATEQAVLSELWTYTGTPVIYSNLPAGLGYADGDFPVAGWWHFGVYKASSTISSPQDNVGTEVALVAYSTEINPGVETELVRVQRPYFDSNTSGEHFEISATVYVPAGAVVRAEFRNFHAMTVPRVYPAGAVGFRYYLGSGDIAQKAGF